MGLTVKNKNSFEISDEIANFFSISLEDNNEKKNDNEFEDLKNDIYNLDIDNEEKAYIINRINLLSTNILTSEKNSIKKQIADFKKKYNI